MPTPLNPRPLAVPQGDWWRHGACRHEDRDLFFSAPHEDPVRHGIRVRLAQSVCEGCSVRAECLEWAAKHEQYGVWGGRDFDKRSKREGCADCAYQVCWNTSCPPSRIGSDTSAGRDAQTSAQPADQPPLKVIDMTNLAGQP